MKGLLDETLNGQGLGPVGNASPIAAPHDVYQCQDSRWCAVVVLTEDEWVGFKRALDNPAWAEDKKFATLSGRFENKAELDGLIATWTKKYTAMEVMAKLQAHGVAAGLVQGAADLAKDPQLRAGGFFVDRPEIGKLVDASPISLSETPARYNRPAPPPGRDNDFVYGKLLGLSAEEMSELKKKGVI